MLLLTLCAGQLVPAPELARGPLEADGSQHAFVEIVTPREVVYAGEVVPLKLRVGVDESFARTNLLQLFVQPLDLPVQVSAQWFTRPSGARCVSIEPMGTSGISLFTFALDDDVVRGVRLAEQRDGRTFAVLELEREFLLERSGELAVPAPSLRFAFTTKFEPDFFLEPQAVDWRLANVRGQPLTLRIEPLPEAGRPAGFTGAVLANVRILAETEARDVARGESFSLRVSLHGLGNLDYCEAPRFDELRDFYVRGVLDEKGGSSRTLVLDMTAKSTSVREIPSLALAYFDPSDPPQYRVASSQPLPLHVYEPAAKDIPVGLAAGGAMLALLTMLAAAALGAVIVAIRLVRRHWRGPRHPPPK